MGSRIVSGLKIALVCLPLAAQGASATGNLDCSIDDKQLNFEFSALTGGAGGIVQINQASVDIKVGDDKALRSKRAIELKNIEQQWIYGNELRVRLGIPDDKGENLASLILIGTYRADDDTYTGRYVLLVYQSGGEKQFKGRMKCG
ncbi:hypothetical protein YH63_004025 [Afipia massiliensis]|uniref:Uncharacterized protein n=1 Tax=Afipia massiliensis TaxID=211460 RepID=A0A4U6BKC0_9BRAD|nr:hypothetical protein [Afipia massiliensis]TKT70642.1 hypothetical protein YH63_004025 [Afipia massiliensis]